MIKDLDQFIQKLKKHDRASLAKAITLIESHQKEHHLLAEQLLDKLQKNLEFSSLKSLKIGVSGPPGVGKSTFIDILGPKLIVNHKTLLVLTYDPSSHLTGGSILGDKTRMGYLSQMSNVFIRPSPSKSTLGGLGPRTFETIQLCEALGFDFILIESVGVGQSEIDLGALVDFFILLLPPGGGDELQGIKRGILEVTDLILINKCDSGLENLAEETKNNFAFSLKSKILKKDFVLKISALNNQGIDQVVDILNKYSVETSIRKNELKENYLKELVFKEILELLKLYIEENADINIEFLEYIKKIMKKKITTYRAASLILEKTLKYKKNQGVFPGYQV